ncbi:prismane alpha-bundle [Lucifera butyrica]|uniref:Hydroxylamine reductase n=1 Tax=Lucifera butyrica TaxID=1351585 RepID=A0A498RC64_9FIRM|nr:hydroxylamine reductase [Lucifera butyrica]VBB07713.1 prismane alpha-bundle [Lucifera butyrica]
MFCNQCEQTARGKGCTVRGVCGKTPEVSDMQDLLMHALRGLAHFAGEGRRVGVIDPDTDRFTAKAIFSTLTNVNFDAKRVQELIEQCVGHRERLKEKVASAGGKTRFEDPAAGFTPAASLDELIKQGRSVGQVWNSNLDEDTQSVQQILVFGIRGLAAYADHAAILGQEDASVYTFIYEALSSLVRTDLSLNDWVALALKCGEVNFLALELLDKANTSAYGHPVPTPVPLDHLKGKCILVSGHDLKDLAGLLEQTEGKGITVYTHGEMLPAHGYPKLKAHKHLYGHFGTAWQNQRQEFERFPGAILMTTNCIQEPRDVYRDNIFTTGMVGWPGIQHVKNGEFGPVIEKARAMPGFGADEDKGKVMVGFAHNTVLSIADKVIEGVKTGAIRHFVLVAGCDGAKPGRNYYTELVEKLPGDTVVLTLACGKFRFFDKQLGDIGGIPRLLDVGQCNDAYSAVKIALALASAFNCGVNELPLSLVLSWYEQKAVSILLTLLHLGIKDIRLGPSLPAFVSPNVLDVLVKNFGLKPTKTPDEDIAAILGRK